MSKKISWHFKIFLGALALVFLSSAQAANEIVSKESHQRRLKFLNERYEDYHLHEAKLQQFEKARRAAIKEQTKARAKADAEREKIRAAYEKRREAKEEKRQAVLKREHEQKLLEEEKERERIRKAYIKKRDQWRSLSGKAKKIPENKEVGLED